MRITVGPKGDYAVRLAIDLARHYGQGRRKAREISAAMDIPKKYLSQILAPLVRRGLLTATAGPDGGYTLTREPERITLLDVIEAADGPLEGTCLLTGGPCDAARACPAHGTWMRAQRALISELRATTLAVLARGDEVTATSEQSRAGSARRPAPIPVRPRVPARDAGTAGKGAGRPDG
ncbi:MAG: Rrf2 family transcriptional regulator [Dehalococcoidia bacterium]